MYNSECILIKDIKPGLKNINVVFIVLDIGAATVTKENREVRNFKVGDHSACINVSIWDEPGKLIAPGDIIRMSKGYASIWRHCLTLYSGKNGEVFKVGEFCMTFNEAINMSEPKRPEPPTAPPGGPAGVGGGVGGGGGGVNTQQQLPPNAGGGGVLASSVTSLPAGVAGNGGGGSGVQRIVAQQMGGGVAIPPPVQGAKASGNMQQVVVGAGGTAGAQTLQAVGVAVQQQTQVKTNRGGRSNNTRASNLKNADRR